MDIIGLLKGTWNISLKLEGIVDSETELEEVLASWKEYCLLTGATYQEAGKWVFNPTGLRARISHMVDGWSIFVDVYLDGKSDQISTVAYSCFINEAKFFFLFLKSRNISRKVLGKIRGRGLKSYELNETDPLQQFNAFTNDEKTFSKLLTSMKTYNIQHLDEEDLVSPSIFDIVDLDTIISTDAINQYFFSRVEFGVTRGVSFKGLPKNSSELYLNLSKGIKGTSQISAIINLFKMTLSDMRGLDIAHPISQNLNSFKRNKGVLKFISFIYYMVGGYLIVIAIMLLKIDLRPPAFLIALLLFGSLFFILLGTLALRANPIPQTHLHRRLPNKT